jgi:hypothetical protein
MDEDLNKIISQIENPTSLSNSEVLDFLFEIKIINFRKPLVGEHIVNCFLNLLISYHKDVEIIRVTLQILSAMISVPEGDIGYLSFGYGIFDI